MSVQMTVWDAQRHELVVALDVPAAAQLADELVTAAEAIVTVRTPLVTGPAGLRKAARTRTCVGAGAPHYNRNRGCRFRAAIPA